MRHLVAFSLALAFNVAGPQFTFGAKKKKDDSADVPKLEDIPKIIEQLKDKDAGVRTKAATAIGARGQLRARDVKDAVAPLANMVRKDDDVAARRAAGSALAKMDPDPKLVLESLIEALKNDKDLQVRTSCATALGALGAEAKDAVSTLQEVRDEFKGAGKKEKEKQALAKAAAGALAAITGSKKK
jgi:HEAT repeat protein